MKCTICGRDAVYEAKYSGEMLCADHFTASVDRRKSLSPGFALRILSYDDIYCTI